MLELKTKVRAKVEVTGIIVGRTFQEITSYDILTDKGIIINNVPETYVNCIIARKKPLNEE